MALPPRTARSRMPISRRRLMSRGVATLGVLAAARLSPAGLGLADPAPGDAVVPFLDEFPDPGGREQVKWAEPQPWITPAQRVFTVGHYSRPVEIDPAAYRLEIFGQFDKPITLTLDQVKARPRKEVTATLECSGNGSNKNFMGAIGNGTWAGTPLAALLKDCGLKNAAVERILAIERAKGEQLQISDIHDQVAGVYPKVMLEGAVDVGAWSCGMVVGLNDDIPTVAELIERIMDQATRLIRDRLTGLLETEGQAD